MWVNNFLLQPHILLVSSSENVIRDELAPNLYAIIHTIFNIYLDGSDGGSVCLDNAEKQKILFKNIFPYHRFSQKNSS